MTTKRIVGVLEVDLASIARPMQVVSPRESIFRTEVRCWVAKALGHGMIELLGTDVLLRNAQGDYELPDGSLVGYASQVRRERWLDQRTGQVEMFHIVGSERDVVIALCEPDGVVCNIISACLVRGEQWVRDAGLIPVLLGNAWDGSARPVVSPGDRLDLSIYAAEA